MKKKKWRVGDILRYQWELEKDSSKEEGRRERRRKWFKQSGFGKKDKRKALRAWLDSRQESSFEKGESVDRSWGKSYSGFVAAFFFWGVISGWIATWAVLVVPSGMDMKIYFFVAMFFLVVLPLLFTLLGFYFFFRRQSPGLLFGDLGRWFFKLGWVSGLLNKISFGLPEGVIHHLLHFKLSQGGAFQRLLKQAFQYRGVGFSVGVYCCVRVLVASEFLNFQTAGRVPFFWQKFFKSCESECLDWILLGSICVCVLARLVLLLLVMFNNWINLINFRDKKSEELWTEMTTRTSDSSGKEPPPEENVPENKKITTSTMLDVVALVPQHRPDLTKERLEESCSELAGVKDVLSVSQDDEEDEAILRSLSERISNEGVVFVVFEGFRPCTEDAVMYVEELRRTLHLKVLIKVGLVNDTLRSQSISTSLFNNWSSRISSGVGCRNIQVIRCDEGDENE